MSVIPGMQDVATFLGGTYSQPQLVSPQINGVPNLPQLYNPTDYQPQSFNSPYATPDNTSLFNAIRSGAQNSGSNHSISSGGYTNLPQNNQQSIFAGLFK